MLRKAATLAGIILLMALAGGQDAKAAPPAQGWGAAELETAAAYWGVTTPPLCGSTEVRFDVTPPTGYAGWATIPTKPETACTMEVAAAQSIAKAHRIYWQCLLVVHEYGHWMGLEHSADTSSPMAAELNSTQHVRGCEVLARSVTNVTHKPTSPR